MIHRTKLSVLIATIKDRRSMCAELVDSIFSQADGRDVEVLCLLDNYVMTIGEKRQLLLDIARGHYVAWVDDDDVVYPGYVDQMLDAISQSPDVVVHDVLAVLGGRPVIVEQRLGHPIQEYDGRAAKILRPPNQTCAWKREIAVQVKFPMWNHGEDFEWAKGVWPLCKTQAVIEEPIYVYRK